MMTSTSTVHETGTQRLIRPVYACTRCHSFNVSLSHVRSVWERFIASFGVKIVRCHHCNTRSLWF